MKTHDVLSALLDDEPFDPQDLERALADSQGRAMLIDLAILRRLVRPTASSPPAAHGTEFRARPRWPQAGLAAAAVLVALIGGYLTGARRERPTENAAPQATRVVQVTSGTTDILQGGHR